MVATALEVKRPLMGAHYIIQDPTPFYDWQAGHIPLKGGELVSFHGITDPKTGFLTVGQDGTYYHLKPGQTKLFRAPQSQIREKIKGIISTGRIITVGKGSGTFGNDPELFALDEKGQVIPAFTFLPHKDKAEWQNAGPVHLLKDSNPKDRHTVGIKVFYDGFQAEYSVPAHSCFGYGCDFMRTGINAVLMAARTKDPKATVTWAPVVDIPQEVMSNTSAEYTGLGCDPSKNAYTDEPNTHLQNLDPAMLPYRFAGFHIHYGIGKHSPATYRRIIRFLDATVGVMSVAIFDGMEDPRRRMFYGLAGEYRTPEHGLEWRVLSSCVLCHPAIYHLFSDMSRMACSMALGRWSSYWKFSSSLVRGIINNLDVAGAKRHIREHESLYRLMLAGPYNDQGVRDRGIKIMMEGAKNLISTNMHSNWSLGGTWGRHSNNDTQFWSKLKF